MSERQQKLTFQSRWMPIILAGTAAVFMVFLAEILHSSEILFPEMCAILCGAWIMPRQPWHVDRKHMFLLMSIGSVFGLIINLLLPSWPLAACAPLGFIFCALMMLLTGTEMAPMFSAAVLPMLLKTDTPVYPIAVCSLVGIVLLGQFILEKLQLREPVSFQKNTQTREDGTAWLLRCAVLCAACPLYAAGFTFMAAPPLLVAFLELTHPESALRKSPVRVWLCLVLAALTGTTVRNAAEAGLLSRTMAAAAGFLILILIWHRLQIWFPPAGALLFLALLAPWPNAWIYLAETAAGSALWIAAAMLIFRKRETEACPDHCLAESTQ